MPFGRLQTQFDRITGLSLSKSLPGLFVSLFPCQVSTLPFFLYVFLSFYLFFPLHVCFKMHASLTRYIEELLPERGNGPAVLTNLWRQQAATNQEGQSMLDLLPADSNGSNKDSMEGRKQIWASKQRSLGLLMSCGKTGILMACF